MDTRAGNHHLTTPDRELRPNGHANNCSDVIDSACTDPCINGRDDRRCDDMTHDIDMTERDMSQPFYSTNMTGRGDTDSKQAEQESASTIQP